MCYNALMIIQAIKTRVFKEGEDLAKFVFNYVPKLGEGDILVVTSKIVALAQGRTAPDQGEAYKIKLIKQESVWARRTKYVWLTLKDGLVMASAGIDESNANGKLILLPRDSFKAARQLRQALQEHFNIKKLGVLITDSRTMPLRAGVTAVALGYAGFKGIRDYRGRPDIFGRKFKFSRTNVADSLATAAVLVMGEGAERQPLTIIKNSPVEFCERGRRDELKIDFKDDMYRPIINISTKWGRPAPWRTQ